MKSIFSKTSLVLKFMIFPIIKKSYIGLLGTFVNFFNPSPKKYINYLNLICSQKPPPKLKIMKIKVFLLHQKIVIYI